MFQTLAPPYALVYKHSPLMRDLTIRHVKKLNIDFVALHYHVSDGFATLHLERVLAESEISDPCVLHALKQLVSSLPSDVVG